MRICLIASSLRRAGAEKQFVYIARALFQAGVELQVFYLGAGDYYQNVLRDAGIPVHQIFTPNRPLLMLCRLLKETARFRPEIVWASQFGDLLFGAPVGRCCGALALGGVRSDGFYEFRTTGRRSRFLVHSAHGLITNSNRAKENLISLGVNPGKLFVLPNGIDLADFDRRAGRTLHNSIPPERAVIAAIGSLQQSKRFDRFLEAFALARLSEPSLLAVIAGKDLGAKTALEAKSRALGLLPRDVLFLGECDCVPALLNRASMLVLCSDYEGFPNVILEAMAARLPVITTPVGDAGHIVHDGSTGYVLKPDDHRAMADCIIRLAQDRDLRSRFGEAGRSRVEQHYSSGPLAERLFCVLRAVADKCRRASVSKMCGDHLAHCRASTMPRREGAEDRSHSFSQPGEPSFESPIA